MPDNPGAVPMTPSQLEAIEAAKGIVHHWDNHDKFRCTDGDDKEPVSVSVARALVEIAAPAGEPPRVPADGDSPEAALRRILEDINDRYQPISTDEELFAMLVEVHRVGLEEGLLSAIACVPPDGLPSPPESVVTILKAYEDGKAQSSAGEGMILLQRAAETLTACYNPSEEQEALAREIAAYLSALGIKE